jgi:exodeoxyribonuclease III
MAPGGPALDRWRIATWNLNSLRVRLPAVERFLERAQPDVLCLQETKAATLPDSTVAAFERRGYHVAHVGTNAYNGVAVLARDPVEDVITSGGFDDEHLDREPRVVSCAVRGASDVRVVSVYVPHGRAVDHWHFRYKLAFMEALTEQVRSWLSRGERVLVAGDINIAATDSDVFHPDAFVGLTHVTPEERAALQRLLDAGLVDLDVACWGARARRFTWWNHGIGYPRNLGMRIDVLAADVHTASRLDTTWIDHTERGMDRPSDHAALIADLHLGR